MAQEIICHDATDYESEKAYLEEIAQLIQSAIDQQLRNERAKVNRLESSLSMAIKSEREDRKLIDKYTAAPELLEALKWAMENGRVYYICRNSCNKDWCDKIDYINDLIAKAEGEK